MTLPQEIEKQISDREDDLVKDMKTDNDRNIGYYQGFCDGHHVGATEWAGKAKPVLDLLEKMVEEFTGAAEMSDKDYDKELIKKSKAAIAKYKEVGK